MKEKLLHKFIAFIIPFLFINCFISLLENLVAHFGVDLGFHWLFRITISLLVGISFLGISSILSIEKIGILGKLRAAIFSLILMYLITIPFNTNPFPNKLIPLPNQWLIMIFVVIECLLISYYQSKYIEREYFLETTKNLDGNELYATMRETGNLSLEASNSLQKTKIPNIIFLIIILLFHFILLLAKINVKTSCYVWTILFCIFWVFANQIIRFSNDEQYYAGLGIGKIFSFFNKRLLYVLLFLLMCFGFAFIFSTNKAILPASLLTALWAWLLSFKRTPKYKAPPQLPDNNSDLTESIDISELLDQLDKTENKDFTWLFNLIKYIFIFSLIIGFLFFLFSVFFKKDFKTFIQQRKLFILIKSFFSYIKESIKSLCRNIISARKKRTQKISKSRSTNDFENSIKTKIKQKKSVEKQEEIGRLSNYFLKLIAWGETFNIQWNITMAPVEYTDFLFSQLTNLSQTENVFFDKETLSLLQDEIKVSGKLFEQSLYAKELLTKDEEKTFTSSIEKILNTQVYQDNNPTGEK